MQPDVLDLASRHEPVFASVLDAALAQAEPAEPAVESQSTQVEFIEVAAGPVLPVDGMIDCVIPMELEVPVHGEKLLPLLQTLRHVGNKPVHFIGHEATRGWEVITRGGIYNHLHAGVQLANRQNALNEIEYSELVVGLRRIADELNAEPEVPDMPGVMQAARDLHQFVVECYAQLSVNVMSRGAPWNLDTLLAALRRHGFDVRPDGKLVMLDGDSSILFTLATNVVNAAHTTSLLTLLLEVPCVPPARDGFGSVVACARMLAQRLDGVVVDDGRQPLSDEALDEIAAQVKDFYAHMDNAGIPAGSARALRLFA